MLHGERLTSKRRLYWGRRTAEFGACLRHGAVPGGRARNAIHRCEVGWSEQRAQIQGNVRPMTGADEQQCLWVHHASHTFRKRAGITTISFPTPGVNHGTVPTQKEMSRAGRKWRKRPGGTRAMPELQLRRRTGAKGW